MPSFERHQSPTPSSDPVRPARAAQTVSRAPHADKPPYARQEALGNQGVQRLLISRTLQAKLRLGQPGDAYEQEADRVADTVMRMPEPEVRRQRVEEDEEERIQTEPLADGITPLVQRQAEAPSEKEEEEEEKTHALQRKAKEANLTHVRNAALVQRLSSPSGGSVLSDSTRSFFERRFGYNFSEVQIHDTYRDRADTASLNARAFTYGKHIWLGEGESATDSRLMAHELTHVVQQNTGVRRQPLAVSSVAPRIQRDLRDRWRKAKERVGSAISSIGESFEDAKAAALGKVAQGARRIPGFDLLTVIMGKDPITDQPVERNAINLTRGVLGLLGERGIAMFENLEKAGAIARTFEWLNAEVSKLNLTWEAIKGLFRTAWGSLSLSDAIDPLGALAKLARIFEPPLARLVNFAFAAGRKVVEFIFEGALNLAGGFGSRVLAIVKRAGVIFSTIINDPIGFLGNLVAALRGGFARFSDNIVEHLRTGLLQWLFGALSGAGLTLPERFDLKGIVSIVLQILGLTYDRLRAKLVGFIGEENVARLEKLTGFLRTLFTEGLGAAWEKIMEYVGNLQEMVIGGIRDWVAKSIVGAAITKLVTMFNPVGAIIQGIMTIYNTIVFFVERAQQIASLAEAVFESVSNIAAGKLGDAISYVERMMARSLPVIIGFLARLIGLGNISGQIRSIIERMQGVVERAIDKVANFVVGWARGQTEEPQQPPVAGAPPVGFDAILARTRTLLLGRLEGEHTREEADQIVAQTFGEVQPWGVRSLELEPQKEDGSSEIIIEVNPRRRVVTMAPKGTVPTMQVVTEVTVEPSFDLSTAEMREMSRPSTIGGRKVAQYQQHGGSGPTAAIILPAAGTPTLLVESWNINEQKMRDDVFSHAESQMVRWLERQSWLGQITRIRIQNYPFNPCRGCGGELTELLQKIKQERKRANKPAEIGATLTWQVPWIKELKGDRADTPDRLISWINDTIALMKGWDVEPKAVDSTMAQKIRKKYVAK